MTKKTRSLTVTEDDIAIIWCVEDVHEERPDLTDEQAREVLRQCYRDHDANEGINWGVIRMHARDLFGSPRGK